MAKDRKKLLHIHSSIPDKQPTAASLEVGEIAVNNAANQEFLSIKNSQNKVKRFSSDEQNITWMEKKEVMPYEGYTRGADGPAGTTGPNSVKRSDLLQNKSNIIIKLNQVAASNTAKHNKVNGSKDIYGKCVNPTTDDGVTDGAGFAIDMSRYAMIGANPSFSSLTVTDKTDLSGNTTIANGDGSGTRTGHTLTIKTTDVVATDTNWTETITNRTSTVTNETDKITTLNESATTRTTVIGTENLHVSGTTTEVHDKAVTITNNTGVTETTKGDVVENVSGTTTINHSGTTTTNESGDTIINTTGNTTINSTGSTTIQSTGNGSDVCLSAADVAGFRGGNNTKIGKKCDGSGQTTVLDINGTTINETGNTVFLSATTNVNVSADTICLSGKTGANVYAPTTNLGVSCGGSTATTINVSGTTINEGGTNINETFTNGTFNITNYDLNGANICLSGSTKANVYGATTNVGIDCNGTTTATTINVSGTTINEGGTTNNNNFTTINNTATTINNKTTNYNITGTTKIDGNTTILSALTVSGDTYIGGTLHLTTGLEKVLSWTYGDVRTNAGCSANDSTNFQNDKCFIIPRKVSDLTNWNGTCYNFDGPLCVTGTITASGAIYSSDRDLKENIEFVAREDFNKAKNIPIKSFNLKEDNDKNKMYGVIAQEVQEAGLNELVYTKEDGHLAVDYTSLMMLKIAYLENFCAHLNGKIVELEDKLAKFENKD